MILDSLLNRGYKETDSVSRIRAIKIANVIALSALVNTFVFSLVFIYLRDWGLVRACYGAFAIYGITWMFTLFGYPNWGRPLNLLSGNLVIFWFSCHMRGGSLLQLFFFSLSVLPFMMFAWEERKFYILALMSAVFIVIGEAHQWAYFEGWTEHYNITVVRVFSILAPMSQILMGFYYFLKQSVHFEKESAENFSKLQLEYKKQIQVHKMSSLGEMAAGVAHEINNPLTIILGSTHRLKKDSNYNPEVDKIETTVARITKIVKALNTFSRDATKDPMQSCSLEKVVAETMDLCRERFVNSEISLDVKIEKDVSILCRPTEISQVLLNLLNNAFDAVHGSKNPWVKVEVKKVNGQHVEILVVDSGPLIAPAIADRLMEPFFTTKEVGRGTGLGLSISKGIIEAHNGRLNYLPQMPHTSFQIILPSVN